MVRQPRPSAAPSNTTAGDAPTGDVTAGSPAIGDVSVGGVGLDHEETVALLLMADPGSAGELASRVRELAATFDEAAAERALRGLARLGLVRAAASEDGRTTYVRTTLGREYGGEYGGDPLDGHSTVTARLAELEQLRTDFVATIAHELKTPLTAIRTCVGLLTDSSARVDDTIRRRLLDRVSASTEGMQHLIENLLDLARYRAGRVELERRWVDALEIAREAASIIGPQLEAHRQVIHFDPPPSTVMVYADRRRLVQALGNILSNAQKFSPTGGAIEVAVRRDGRDVRWEVRDFGPGISAEDQRHLFERFFRGRSDVEGGSGLGLPIALATVQAHGGTITVDSELGTGSTFRVTLPFDGDGDNEGAPEGVVK